MTRTPDEVVNPLPGQMAFGFMHAGSGPAECLEPEQEGPAIVPTRAAGDRLAGGRNPEKGPRSRRPESAWSGDAVGADEEQAGHFRAPGRLTRATSPNYARDIGRRAQPVIWSGLASGPMTRWAARFRETGPPLFQEAISANFYTRDHYRWMRDGLAHTTVG